MILNSFAVLDGSVAFLRLIVGLIVICLGLGFWRSNRGNSPEERKASEDRFYLLFLLALLLLILNVLSWPLVYLLLQSYVPEWPGVMCIYGVTQIGVGSEGTARFLPTLVKAIQWLKPLLIFVAGIWFVLHLLNRHSQTGILTKRVVVVLVLCGMLAVADSGVELSYLAIPKKEEVLATGCCPVAFNAAADDRVVTEMRYRPSLDVVYFVSSFGMALALLKYSKRTRPHAWELSILCAAAVSTFFIGRAYLAEVLAPAILHLPYHHCPYDLIAGATETLVGIGLFVGGTFSAGWACVVAWLGRGPETETVLPALFGRIAFLGFCCYFSAAVMAAVELALA